MRKTSAQAHSEDLTVAGPSASTSASPAVSATPGRDNDGKGDGSSSKKSQRPSWSCTECTRRKIKCDRVIPCQQCCRRGKAATCQLAAQDAAKQSREPLQARQGKARLATSTEFDAIRQSVADVRQRLYNLENLLSNFVPSTDAVGPDGRPLYNFIQKAEDDSGVDYVDESISPGVHHAFWSEHHQIGTASHSEPTLTLPNAINQLREDGQIAESDGEVEAAVTLEFLALGRDRKQDHFRRSAVFRPEEEDDVSTSPNLLPSIGTPWGSAPDPSQLFLPGAVDAVGSAESSSGYAVPGTISGLDNLPSQSQSEVIVRYSLERVAWQHGAVHTGSFKAECEEFFGWGERRSVLVNQAWLALYWAILCVGVRHMSIEALAGINFSEDEARRIPKQYFDASVESLHRSNFLAKHSIYSVQAIVILVVTCQDVGGSDLIATLLACGIRIAQHLNIHRFSTDAAWDSRRRNNGVDPTSPEGVKGLIDREIRKRLWCALATEDWVSIPYRRSYAIFPSHFSTPLPINCHDEDLSAGIYNPRPLEEPTFASKTILSMKVASCIRRFFEDVNSSGGLSYDLCLQIDKEIRDIMRDAPSYLRSAMDVSHLPSFVSSFRNYWVMSVSHKLLVIHRTFLGRSFRDPRYSYSRKAAIEAARGILQRFTAGSHLPQHIWTAIYHAISASTILILDVFQSSSSDPSDDVSNKRAEVQAALDELRRLEESSPIAARGAQLLGTLLSEEAKHRRSNGEGSRKRKAIDQGDRFGDVAKRVVGALPGSHASAGPSMSPPSGGATIGGNMYPYFTTQASPGESQISDGSLTQDAFDSIFNGLGAQLYGTAGSPGTIDTTADFWRLLDAFQDPPVADSPAGQELLGYALSGTSGRMDGLDSLAWETS